MKKIDLTGRTFGRLTVISEAQAKSQKVRWYCSCACGQTSTVLACNLTSGKTSSCGCMSKTGLALARKHGMHGTPEYSVWRGMKNRCLNPLEPAFPSYGGRGIKVCERWLSFESFRADMGERPECGTIERIDVNGDYCPENCKWVTLAEQQANRRNTVRVQINGKTQPLKYWCKELGRSYKAVHLRLTRYGYSIDRALDLPSGSALLT